MSAKYGVLLDLDGVLYNADELIPGAVQTVAWLCTERIPHLYITNTTSRPRSLLVEKLRGFGFRATEAGILTPAVVAAAWLRAHNVNRVALFVPPATRNEFVGLSCLPDDAEQGASDVVIGDLGRRWDFPTLNRAFRLLHNEPEARLIALGMTRYWRAPDGISLDVAPFVAALENATGRKALVFGKPATAFFQAAADMLNLLPNQILMIGDDIVADVRGAEAAGFHGALVQTGKYQPADLDGEPKPDLVLKSIAELPRLWPSVLNVIAGLSASSDN